MPDWNLVGKQHVLAAIAECDRIGAREFLQRYRFGRAQASTLWHRGQEYDSRAILGVAYLHATGRAATSADLAGDEAGAANALTGLGFDVVVDEEALEASTKPRPRKATGSGGATGAARAPRATRAAAKPPATPRRTAASDRPVNVCPTCFMAIPATGVCDNCG